MKELFTVAELAARWGCSESAIKARLQNGTLAKADVPGTKISYEEIRAHEVVVSYGRTADERELISRLAALTTENEKLKKKYAALSAWRQKLAEVMEESYENILL